MDWAYVSDSLTKLALRQWGLDSERIVEFLLQLGTFPDVAYLTHFESFLNPKVVHDWLTNPNNYVRVISVDSEFVGLLAAHPPISVGVPEDYLETSTYIVHEWRNRGVGVKAWELAERELATMCPGLAGVTWSDNTVSIRRLKRSGYQFLTDAWYDSRLEDGHSGWCQVWVKSLQH